MRHALMTNWMQEVDDMFRTYSPTAKAEPNKAWFSPAVDVKETEKEYLFHFDLPGLTDKDIEIKLTGRELYVSGERKTVGKDDSRSHRNERYFGRFERSFVLPEEVNSDKIDAEFRDGVLTIRIPKIEAVQPKTIPIRTH
ncbi:MAG: Hsp20/alpha crystallin family protein [Pseudobdellovibrionaceae bacterium]